MTLNVNKAGALSDRQKEVSLTNAANGKMESLEKETKKNKEHGYDVIDDKSNAKVENEIKDSDKANAL